LECFELNVADYHNKLTDFFVKVPRIDWRHIKSFTNNTGILQHAKFNIPNYHYGYCLDDNCRALLLTLMASEMTEEPFHEDLAKTYLSFILYAQEENGWFRNFMSYDLSFLESIGSEDSMGRTIWTLGYLLAHDRFSLYHPISKEIFDKIFNHLTTFRSIRAIAYTVLGLLYFIEKYPEKNIQSDLLDTLLQFLVKEYKSAKNENWKWFEEIISYDNAIIPLSLLKAGRQLNNQELVQIGLESSIFLDKILFRKGYLSTIGNIAWFKKNEQLSEFGQQPLEVSSIILWYQELMLHKQELNCTEKIKLAFLWFLGFNDKEESLFNFENMACYDGLEPYGTNKNQGAESNISFWMSYVHLYNLK